MNIELGGTYEIENEKYMCFKEIKDVNKIYYGMQKFSKPMKTLFVYKNEFDDIFVVENSEEKKHILDLIKKTQ